MDPITIIVIVLAVFLLILIAAVITLMYQRRKVLREDGDNIVFQPRFSNPAYNYQVSPAGEVEEVFKDVEIFDYSNIREGELIGRGQYGDVFKGEVKLQGQDYWTMVAIKKPKDGLGEVALEDFHEEIRLMLELGSHPNLISVLGCCTIREPFYLMTDLMEYGDLLHFLKKAVDRENWERDSLYKITTFDQLQIARQIAAGMNYVSQTRFFHGDLAARNILVGKELSVRITDFGLTDELYQRDYTRFRAGAKLPYKWYSPESIERKYCTLKTDVWSYGILLWEMVTFGQHAPYHGMSIPEVLHRLKEGYRMSFPKNLPIFFEKLIQICWQTAPEDRPDFANLHESISFLVERGADNTGYITAEEQRQYEIIDEKTSTLIEKLDLESATTEDISGSTESAYLGEYTMTMVIPTCFKSCSDLSSDKSGIEVYSLSEEDSKSDRPKSVALEPDAGHGVGGRTSLISELSQNDTVSNIYVEK